MAERPAFFIYQGKVVHKIYPFENGGPYLDLLEIPPKEAKRDKRLHNSGSLKGFHYQNMDFPLIPKTAFYDYIYIAAVRESFTTQEKAKEKQALCRVQLL